MSGFPSNSSCQSGEVKALSLASRLSLFSTELKHVSELCPNFPAPGSWIILKARLAFGIVVAMLGNERGAAGRGGKTNSVANQRGALGSDRHPWQVTVVRGPRGCASRSGKLEFPRQTGAVK